MRRKHNDHDHGKFCFAHLALWWSLNDASVCLISAIKQHTRQFDSGVGVVNSQYQYNELSVAINRMQ